MITIGNDFGGPELRDSVVLKLLSLAMKAAAESREQNYNDGSSAWINPVYIVPGSIRRPEFQGYKIGHFSKKNKGLVVMIAVPNSVMNEDDMPDFIVASLKKAVQMADEYFFTKNIPFSVSRAESIIDKIASYLQKS